jgi:hypothetical protein
LKGVVLSRGEVIGLATLLNSLLKASIGVE